MQFITIKNQTGDTVAINPKRITNITLFQGHVIVSMGVEKIYTQFTTIRDAADYIEKAYIDRSIASAHREAVDNLWQIWGDI